MNQKEKLEDMIRYFANENLTTDQEVVVVLTCIAQSLAVIADTMTIIASGEKNNTESEV